MVIIVFLLLFYIDVLINILYHFCYESFITDLTRTIKEIRFVIKLIEITQKYNKWRVRHVKFV